MQTTIQFPEFTEKSKPEIPKGFRVTQRGSVAAIRKIKPENGKLVAVVGGKDVNVNGCYDLPWALLQSKRQELIRSGSFKKEQLKLRYL